MASTTSKNKEEGPKIVIIGSGPCGLGAAYRCQELDHENFVVLESESEAGGLSITATDENGFLWDMGMCIHIVRLTSGNSNIHTCPKTHISTYMYQMDKVRSDTLDT